MKRNLLLPICLLFVWGVNAQDESGPVYYKWEQNYQRETELNYYNRDYCDYYLCLENQSNYELRSGKNTIFRYSKHTDNTWKTASRYMYFKGKRVSNLDINFLYALPVRRGDSTQVKISPSRMRSYAFRVAPSDTIYAMREGVVCRDEASENKLTRSAVSKGLVLVYHKDKTFAAYQGFSEILVHPGEWVKVGDPIGLSPSADSYPKQLFTVCFYFLDNNKFPKAMSFPEGSPYTAFTPKVRTSNAGDLKLEENVVMKAVLDEKLITQDMTKAELKRYQAKMKKNQKK